MPVPTPPAPTVPGRVLQLGRCAYGDALQVQRDLVAARQQDQIPDTLVLVEHPDVITLGRGSHRQNLIAPADIPIYEIERGGDVTYHGPGQLVGYPIFLLREHERDLHRFLRNIEQALIDTCAAAGVTTGRNPGWTGVWTTTEPRRKLASIGVACKRWVTLHGFALNVCTDLARFSVINPCGLDAGVMASLASTRGQPISLDEISPPLIQAFAAVFGRTFDDLAPLAPGVPES